MFKFLQVRCKCAGMYSENVGQIYGDTCLVWAEQGAGAVAPAVQGILPER